MSMSNTLTLMPTLRWSGYVVQVLEGFSQMWWQMLILTSIKANRFRSQDRKSKRVISTAGGCGTLKRRGGIGVVENGESKGRQ